MPGGLYEAGNVSYGIPYSGPVTTALSTPCPPPTPSPHLVSCFAPHTLLHPTSGVTLPCLCPSVPVVQRHEYEYEYEQNPAHLHDGSALISINQPHYRTVPHTSTVIYCTVLTLGAPSPDDARASRIDGGPGGRMGLTMFKLSNCEPVQT